MLHIGSKEYPIVSFHIKITPWRRLARSNTTPLRLGERRVSPMTGFGSGSVLVNCDATVLKSQFPAPDGGSAHSSSISREIPPCNLRQNEKQVVYYSCGERADAKCFRTAVGGDMGNA
jgi:hypothetical protein